MVQKSNSFVKDTTDFINKVESLEKLHQSSIIGTLDVTSLYTNIPNDEGIASIKNMLDTERLGDINPKNETLIELLGMVLKSNNFQFNGQNFLQISGTAMGTRVAPSYANLFMTTLENKFLENHELKPRVWLRYIDDIFFVWDHGENELKIWLEYLNQQHHSIKFTSEWSENEISFLDTKVKRDSQNKMYTDLYTKPTDTNSYLRYDSAHPPCVKRSLPYSQFLRLRRICRNEEDFQRHAEIKADQFREKGYPEKLIQEAIEQASIKRRVELLERKKKDKKEQERIFLTTTFRPQYNKMQKIVKRRWDELGESCTTRGLQRMDLVVGHRRPKNLRDLLVRAKVDYHPENDSEGGEEKVPRTNSCVHKPTKKHPVCEVCPKMDKSGKMSINKNCSKETKTNIHCGSSNIVYCIECKCCGKRYVGETQRTLQDRISEHIGDVEHKRYEKSEVAYHFNRPGHKKDKDMKVYILEFIYEHPLSKRANKLRKTIEWKWVQRLKSLVPNGMNIMENRYG